MDLERTSRLALLLAAAALLMVAAPPRSCAARTLQQGGGASSPTPPAGCGALGQRCCCTIAQLNSSHLNDSSCCPASEDLFCRAFEFLPNPAGAAGLPTLCLAAPQASGEGSFVLLQQGQQGHVSSYLFQCCSYLSWHS